MAILCCEECVVPSMFCVFGCVEPLNPTGFVRGGFRLTPPPAGDFPVECATCGRTETWLDLGKPDGRGVLGCPDCDE